MDGIDLIKQERERQINEEGWTAEHDDEHINGELVLAAICYAFPDLYSKGYWPWGPDEFKPTTKIKDLIKADALIAAEIDRLLRIKIKQSRENLIPEIKRMVNDAFGEFGEEDDNIIILSSCYYSEEGRGVYEIEEPLERIQFFRGNNFGSKLYFPIGRKWDLRSQNTKGEDINKLSIFNNNYVNPICNALNSCGIEYNSEDYYRYDNDALNDYWYGCIGIMRDYKIVSFVIRGDGFPCSDNAIDKGWNKIIDEL